MYDQLTETGRERWAMLLDEADEVRRARRAAPIRRATFREQLAAALIALARRLAPAAPAPPAAPEHLAGAR